MFFLFLYSACAKDEIEQVFEPKVYVEESIVEKSNLHLAFPTITGKSDGSKLLIAYREGNTHISFDGKIIQKESYDQGRTWTNRKILVDPGVGSDARDPQFIRLSDGSILCRFFVRTSQTSSSVKYIYSTDGGKTYNGFEKEFPMPLKNETFAAARGNMVQFNDTIYSTAYNRRHESWLLKSPDKGQSWEFVSWIDRSDKSINNNTFRELNESSLCVQDEIMYIVARSGSEGVRKLHVAQSNNYGNTWETWKELSIYGQAPSLTSYKDKYILSYRNTNREKNTKFFFEFNCILFKDGDICSKPVVILETATFDIGYGDIFTFNNFFLLCCYTNNTIHCFKMLYNVFEEN